MSRRLRAMERRPDRIMSFLARIAEAPKATSAHLLEQAAAAERKRQRMHVPSASAIALPLQPPPLSDAAVDGVWQWAPEPKLATFEQPTGSSRVQQVQQLEGGGGGAAVETPFPFCLLGQCFF
jgi:heat shock transcription factor